MRGRLPFRTPRIWVVAFAVMLSACTDLALQTINIPSYLAENPQKQRGLAYGDQAHQKLDLYLPNGSVENRRQLVVFIYGGAWSP